MITGIDKMTGYKIKTTPENAFSSYGNVYLVFSPAGSKTITQYDNAHILDTTETREECK